ncbi:MAG: penicillin-binding protein 2 [Kiritimatiellae bacterium]|nr:penicillin-binding protein 2 [Kiritimatiellia bacterium]
MTRTLLDQDVIRIKTLLWGMLIAFSFLGFMLWRIQVSQGDHYKQNLKRQSVRRVRLPGTRGRILDRSSNVLADNRPSYCIAVYPEELRQSGPQRRIIARIRSCIDQLSTRLELPSTLTAEEIAVHLKKRKPLPLLVWRDIDYRSLARWAERAPSIPGADIHIETVRVYPQKLTGCHVLGYVGRAVFEQEEEDRFHYYVPEMEGKSGVEKQYDEFLRGQAGGYLVRVDASGYRYEDTQLNKHIRKSSSGQDLILSLDIHVQHLAEEALGDDVGAVVIMDPRSGDVLAMASSPRFDPNLFLPSMSVERWNALIQDPEKPLFNRTVAGNYAPGSVFKPVVALAALENQKVLPSDLYHCPGAFMLGHIRFKCAHKTGHGQINMQQALAYSCNVYFYKVGLQAKRKAIYYMAYALGLGQKTGIGLDYENGGLLPNDSSMRIRQHRGWSAGDTLNFSIGQGSLTVTPLQMAVITSAIANKGVVYKPRLVMGMKHVDDTAFRPIPVQTRIDMNWSEASIDLVRQGMRDVIMAPYGTGKAAKVPGLTMAGKTGTAEFGPKGHAKYRGWMIAFAPFDDPRYAVAMVIDEATSGGTTVAPKIKQLMTGLFKRGASKVEGQESTSREAEALYFSTFGFRPPPSWGKPSDLRLSSTQGQGGAPG